MLKVPQKLEYAMRAMIELAQRRDEGALVPAREIAERQQIPLRFLEQQLGALSKAGLVESFRGAGGGCRLARDPADITIAQIADAIEGQIFPMFCLEPSRSHVLRGLTLWAAGILGRRGARGAEGVRGDDGGGPRGPPPGRHTGADADRPEQLLSRSELSPPARQPADQPLAFAASMPMIFVSFVPQTGHVPCSAGRPFFSVTSDPVNSRFARHFMQ